MKKTLITLMALAGVAVGATNDGSIGSSILTLPGTGASTYISWLFSYNSIDNVTSTSLERDYGVYAGNNGGNLGSLAGTAWETNATEITGKEGYWVQGADGTSGTITLAGRNGTQGESVVLVLGNEIDDGTVISSISLSSTVPANSNLNNKTFDVAIGVVNSNGVVKQAGLQDALTMSSGADGTITFTLSDIPQFCWNSTSKIIVTVAGPAFTPATNTYNVGIDSVTFNYVPEPATATLSLLALAGLAARRRRK